MTTRLSAGFSIAMTTMLVAAPIQAAPSLASKPAARRAQAMYQKQMYDEAFKLALPLAEKGDPAAQALAAEMYSLGRGTAADAKAAAGWYRKSAQGGSAFGQNAFAALLINGTVEVPKDRVEAYKYLALARVQDSRTATDPMTNIGASAASLNLDTLDDVMTKEEIHEALKRAFPKPDACAPLVAAHLKDTENADADIRRRAVTNLGVLGKFGALGSATGKVVTRLAAVVRSDAGKDYSAGPALEKIGPPAVPELIKLLGDKDAAVRSIAKSALKAIGTPEALSALDPRAP